ncbi:hypothetical protein TpMuguga_03g02575 [Theileria parva strain Muguga]|uniref:uncharacterized protein n=1 Tax=Theileria parva strain Muguga TaxID=333668 RepID=UPI001C61C605|nr:uncharacterized protein TpMuguga_03g02575 [Theileria parva strain Muguga]KAF5153143.1 hypothetical protein TpMuguga_03g02575 [Theileria parva strain Muguga]
MEQLEEERVGIHKSINIYCKRLITAYYSILESCQIDTTQDSILRTQIDNFQVKLHNDSFMHSCRSLCSIAADLAISSILHSTNENTASNQLEEMEQLYQLQQQIKQQLNIITQ